MKRKAICALCLCLTVLLTGCDLWMSGEYYSEHPHLDESSISSNTDIEVSSYTQLRNQLVKMVSTGTENCVIYYSTFNSSRMDSYMSSAIEYILNDTPIGAYAVQQITYDSGISTGKQAVAVTVSYNHGRSEILRIKSTETMEELANVVAASLRNYDSGVTISVNKYEELDLQQFAQDFMDHNPDVCMELPQVVTNTYPQKGENRIVEVLFSYQTSRDELRKMQQTVSPVFDSAELYVSGDAENSEKYFQLYSFLMERHNYKFETSITPTYHLLRHGVGDSKAFAAVYASMCRRAGLDCRVVTGTKDGESRYWNVIFDGEKYLYIDLLACNAVGKFAMKQAQDMTGYVWDYDLYLIPEE